MVVLADKSQLILFENTAKEAAAKASKEFSEKVVDVERLKMLDQFAPGPIPMEHMLTDLGFQFHCGGCNEPVDERLFNFSTGRHMHPVYEDEMQMVFCDTDCVLVFHDEQRKRLH